MTLSATAADQVVGSRAVARPQRWMFVIVAATILAIVLIGFAPTLYLRTRVGGIDQALGNNSLPVHLVVHGVVLTAWFSLLLIQPSLVATGNRRMHMRLGLLGIAVAVGVVATGVYTLMQYVVRMKAVGQVLKATPDQVEAAMKQFAVPVIVGDSLALLVFVILFSAAIYWRAKPVAHKRLMLLSSLFILGPAFSSVRPVGETLDPLLGHEAPWLFSPGYVSPRSCGSTTRPRDDFSALLCGEPVFSPLLLDWRAP